MEIAALRQACNEEEETILSALMIEKQRLQMRNSSGEEWQKSIHRAKRSRLVYLPSDSRNSEFPIFCPDPFQIPSSKHLTGNCSIRTSGGCSAENVSTSPDNYSFDFDGLMSPSSDKNDEQQLKKRSNLRDVTLTVETHNYQEQRVPLVSLTSGLNLSAIVGHPIEVDALDDNDKFHNKPIRMFWPIWKTSRRTHVCYVQPTLHHQMTKKPLKKPQTIAIADGGRSYEDNIQINKSGDDNVGADVVLGEVTCIPVKIVFSRLLVAVGS